MQTILATLSDEARAVYTSLVSNKEASSDTLKDGRVFHDIYLDNAKPSNLTANQYRAYLRILSVAGLYRVTDGYAWGQVRTA